MVSEVQMTKHPYPNWRPRHEEVLLWMLSNPGGKQHACAKATGYTPSQVSRIVNSPGYRKRYEATYEIVRREVPLLALANMSISRD